MDSRDRGHTQRRSRGCSTAEQEQKRSDAQYTPPQRTPDADDFCDALFLRAVLTRAGDRKTADMLEAAAWRIRELECKEGKKNAES